jgi:hypothetical protein
MASKM